MNSCVIKSVFSNISSSFACVSEVCNQGRKQEKNNNKEIINEINLESGLLTMSSIKQNKPQIQQHFPQIAYLEASIEMAIAQESGEKKMLGHHQCPSEGLAHDY